MGLWESVLQQNITDGVHLLLGDTDTEEVGLNLLLQRQGCGGICRETSDEAVDGGVIILELFGLFNTGGTRLREEGGVELVNDSFLIHAQKTEVESSLPDL